MVCVQGRGGDVVVMGQIWGGDVAKKYVQAQEADASWVPLLQSIHVNLYTPFNTKKWHDYNF